MSFILLGILNSQATAGAGGGPAYDLLSTTVLSSTANSVTFSSIDSSYKHLQLRITARSDFSNIYNDSLHTQLTFNSDTSTIYTAHYFWGNQSNLYSQFEGATQANIMIRYNTAVGSNTTNGFAANVIDILDYTNTSKFTTTRSITGYRGGNSEPRINMSGGLWQSTAAVTSITLKSSFGDYVSGSRFSLYGIKG